MDNLILSQILLPDILEQFRQVVREELMNSTAQTKSEDKPTGTMTSSQLAEYLNVSTQTIANYSKKKKIPVIKIGSNYRYELNAVLKALNKQ